jgi:hypothetical protein
VAQGTGLLRTSSHFGTFFRAGEGPGVRFRASA